MSKPTHDDAQITLQLVQASPVDATDWSRTDE